MKGLPLRAARQLHVAARALLGARDLTAMMEWADREGIGWHHLVLEDRVGSPRFDLWLLTSGDDGVFFEFDAADHSGLLVSQSYVVDVHAARGALVDELQIAFDQFVPPVFRGWLPDDPFETVKLSLADIDLPGS